MSLKHAFEILLLNILHARAVELENGKSYKIQ